MKKNLFPQDQLDSPEDYDLCVRVNGVYLDVVRNDRTTLWSVHWNNHKVADDIVSRGDAIVWCEENVKDLKCGKVEYLGG